VHVGNSHVAVLQDVAEAEGQVSPALLQRLILKPQKIQQLADGIRAIAAQEEPIRRVMQRMEVADGKHSMLRPRSQGLRGRTPAPAQADQGTWEGRAARAAGDLSVCASIRSICCAVLVAGRDSWNGTVSGACVHGYAVLPQLAAA
jgi:hypothetical protein